jgi:hypothetical protein
VLHLLFQGPFDEKKKERERAKEEEEEEAPSRAPR